MSQIPTRLKVCRIRRKLSQVELSALCGLPQSAISAIENQKRSVTVRTLNRICEALNISFSELVAEENPFKTLDRHELDKIAQQVITGKRELTSIENEISDRFESVVLTKLRAVGVSRKTSNPNKRFFASKRWKEIKELYPQDLINSILDRVDKHLWRYACEEKRS